MFSGININWAAEVTAHCLCLIYPSFFSQVSYQVDFCFKEGACYAHFTTATALLYGLLMLKHFLPDVVLAYLLSII